jgi:hypothetical protein
MKIGSVQIGWILAAIIVLGFFIPWVRFTPKSSFDNSLAIAAQLASGDDESQLLYDYVLMSGQDWQALWQNPAEGDSGYQIVLAGKDGAGNNAAKAFAKILFGDDDYWFKSKLMVLAPLFGILGAVALMKRKNLRKFMIGMIIAEAAFYLLMRWQLHEVYVVRLVLELNWGIWLTLYGLALMAIVQTICLLLPPKAKW